MKRFVVSFINFFDNELESIIIEAENKIQSYQKFFINKGYDINYIDFTSEETIKQSCFDIDCMVNSVEI